MPAAPGSAPTKDRTLVAVEVAHIPRGQETVNRNISRAAEILGTSRRNLHRKINQYNLKK
jgi:DNA-binding NtrC family response regulator